MRSTTISCARRCAIGLIAAGVTLLAGCSDGETLAPTVTAYRAEPTRTSYVAGDSVFVLVRNVASHAITISDCLGTLERLVGSDWVMVSMDHPNCADASRVVPAGGELQILGGVLPATVAAGQYRYELSGIWLGDAGSAVDRPTSAVFLVRAD